MLSLFLFHFTVLLISPFLFYTQRIHLHHTTQKVSTPPQRNRECTVPPYLVSAVVRHRGQSPSRPTPTVDVRRWTRRRRRGGTRRRGCCTLQDRIRLVEGRSKNNFDRLWFFLSSESVNRSSFITLILHKPREHDRSVNVTPSGSG